MAKTPTNETTTKPPAKPERSRRAEPILLEVAWEVCNKLGGIYTVLRSKAPQMREKWGNRYCLVGPYAGDESLLEFDPAPLTGPIGRAVKAVQDLGIGAHYGRWLVTGRPNVVLLNYLDVFPRLHEVKYRLWQHHEIPTPGDDEMLNNAIAFAEVARVFFGKLAEAESKRRDLIAHFHEWLVGATIPLLRGDGWPGSTVFTTHATLLGRYLAMNDQNFYGHLPQYNPFGEADKFLVDSQFRIERAAAHGAQVFTTVSDLTAEECNHLLGRKPDILLPNGLNIQRFAAPHEFQTLHREYKSKIHEFTMGHFFPSYHFDLDETIYLFTSGRFEYRNKGMDLTVEALAQLNHRLKQSDSKRTVVAFIITRRPVRSMNVTALQTSAMLKELQTISDAIKEQVGQHLFERAAAGEIPDLNTLIDDYWRLRLRRTIQAWRRDLPPGIVTHDLQDDVTDPVLNALRHAQLWNQEDARVKVIYHPDFITTTSPLFGLEYDQFVRGCHLGIFPSYYEPWGYTPLESIALGVPAITSDLSGFGSYAQQILPEHEQKGLWVLPRKSVSWAESAAQLSEWMFRFSQLNSRDRIRLRNRVESFSEHFDWGNLIQRYHEAHELAVDRLE